MQRLRTILFYVFAALYLAGTPMAILYALGYQIRPGRAQSFIKTGLISLRTEPSGARVYLGNSRYRWKTPTMIRDLKPGDYPIRLTLRDHQPWSATVRVEPEKATILDHLLLLPNQLPLSTLSTLRMEDLRPVPDEEAFLLQAGKLGADLYVGEIGGDEVRHLMPSNDVAWAWEILSIHHRPDNPCVLLEGRDPAGTHFGWRRLDQLKEPTLDITSLFPQPVQVVAWDAKSRNELFTLADQKLNRLDLGDRALYPDLVGNVRSFALYRNELYVLDASNQLYRTSRDGERKPEHLGQAPSEIKQSWFSRRGYELHPLDEDTVLLVGPDGQCLINRVPYQIMEKGWQGNLRHPDEKLLLLWDQRRIGRFAFPSGERDPQLAAPAAEWLYTSPRPIEQVFWCHENSHLLIAGAGQLDLLPLERGGGPPARWVANYEPGTSVFYSERAGAAYFLEPGSGLLKRLQILNRLNLRSLTRSTKPDDPAEAAQP